MTNIGPIKRTKKVMQAYSDVDIEKLKQNALHTRDRALICFLYSTGCRISEALRLNISDINLTSLECNVLGKGDKERTVYLDAITAMSISDYLAERKDNNEALFVTIKAPHERITGTCVRKMLVKLGAISNVEHVHPHKFRRSRATKLVRHGMPIQQVAAILGHEKLDTTMKYVVMDKNDIKNSYQKYV